jgi:hypothetical protein
MALDGRPAKAIPALQAEKEPEDVQIGEEQKAETKEGKEKALEQSRQTGLTEYFLKYAAPEKERQLYAQLIDLRSKRSKLEDAIPTVMIMTEMKKPRETFVLGRGQYDNPKEKVSAGVPAFLPPMAPGLPMNRLGLAKWIVSPSNPFTARVAVNHFWQEYFGVGIVKTSETLDRRVSSPVTLSCSTGWPQNSCARGGTSRPCSG